MKIGIPRGLLYYQYLPLWKVFFEQLGAEVVTSASTNEETLRIGCSRIVGDVCLPVKVYCGHAVSLVGECDYLFIPSVHAMDKGVYNCPKFIGVPDLVRMAVPEGPPILDPDIDVNKKEMDLGIALLQAGRTLTASKEKLALALKRALAAQDAFTAELERGLPAPCAIEILHPGFGEVWAVEKTHPAARIAVIGHKYMLYDGTLNQRLLHHLRQLDVEIILPEKIGRPALMKGLHKLVDEPYWGYEEEIVGAGGYFLESGVEGLIATTAFTCGPDSMMLAIVQSAAKRASKPLLNLVFDEHTAEGGLITRLEAFVDMVRRSRNGAGSSFVITRRDGGTIDGIKGLGIPNLGLVAPAFRESAKMLDVALIVPPVTRRTISLGTRYAPECSCLPFKSILGTFVECLEQGADTLFMVTSSNACRMGYYVKVYEEVLRDLGYEFNFLKHPGAKKSIPEVLKTVRSFTNHAPWSRVIAAYRLGVAKLRALDNLERKMEKMRPHFADKGQAESLFRETIRAIDLQSDLRSLKKTIKQCFGSIDSLPRDESVRPLKVGLVGEMYVVMEPFVNLNVEAELGKLNVEVLRNRSTFFSEYMNIGAYLNVLNKDKGNLAKYAYPYMHRDVGGHGLESLAEKVHLAREGYDGIVHVIPFTCMPECIAQNIMRFTAEDIPVMTLVCDEQTTQTGMLTRLEAFVDLLERRRRHGRKRDLRGKDEGIFGS